MRKIILPFLAILFFCQCSSVKKHNELLQALIPVHELQSDIDFTYKKLQALHPNVYGYIDKELLDYKFDSLKKTINTPLKPLDFYKKVSPLVAAIRQGHTYMYAPMKRYTKKETEALIKNGTGPFSQFDFTSIGGKVYVMKNKSTNKAIQKGSEVIAINQKTVASLLTEHNNYYTSDGYNTTFKETTAANRLSTYFTIENGIKDSLDYQFKYNDSLQSTIIRRLKPATPQKDSLKNQPKIVPKKLNATERKAKRKKNKNNGFNKEHQNYNRNLDFVKKDSSVAVIKIRAFSNRNYKRFHKETFELLEQKQTKTLVLDLRNNGGGRLAEIADLYAYLSDSSFVFLQKSQVVSKASLFKGAYWNGGSVPVKILKALFSPIAYSYILATVHKDSTGKNYYATETKEHKVNPSGFKGQIYVLINGGSFSASSILAANLQGAKRATFVGQETGGAFNGTVAGFMPIFTLPASRLKIRIGIMEMRTPYKTPVLGHGVFPDTEIIPSVDDLIHDRDPELDWILHDIENAK